MWLGIFSQITISHLGHGHELLTPEPSLCTEDCDRESHRSSKVDCDLFIANDTGPMHMATALGIPTICLFGPGNYHKFRPLSGKHIALRYEVACSPCKPFNKHCQINECMQGISVDLVWEATCQQLNKNLSY